MQRKYQQQLASTALKRGNSSASVVVAKRDPSLRKEALLKVEPVAKRAPVEDEMTVGEMLRTPKVEARVEAGKMQEARSSFFSSMIAASSNSSTSASVQKLGTSIVPAGV